MAEKDTTIWLSWVFESNPGVRYIAGTPGRASSGQAWAYGMPATFGSSTVASYKYSICANYTVEDYAPQVTLIGNPYMYTARAYDIETGLYYYRARYYNPHIGRFLQVDPARDGMNWYAYCGNNSMNFTDPSGLYKEFYITFNPSPTAANQVSVSYSNIGPDSSESYSYVFAHYGAFAKALDQGFVFPDNIQSIDPNFIVVHFIGNNSRIPAKTFSRICAGLKGVFIDTNDLTLINPHCVPFEWDWGELWNGFWLGLNQGSAAVSDGIIPIWDPFSDYYKNADGSINGVFQLSQDAGVLTRDLVIFGSGLPTVSSLKSWVGNIYYYEKGSTTVSGGLWQLIQNMDPVSRGIYLKNIGVGAYGPGSLSEFLKTIPTGGTPGANLFLVGACHWLDSVADYLYPEDSDR